MADIILLSHFAFILFVIVGQSLIMLGYHLGWRWALNRVMRTVHLCCVLFVVVQAWVGRWCPLTIMEHRYRLEAGQDGYQTSFIQYWIGRLIYYDAPPWVFVSVYTLFAMLVLVYWMLVRRKTRAAMPAPSSPQLS